MKVITNKNIVTMNLHKIRPNLTQDSLFQIEGVRAPTKKSHSKSQEILTPASEESLNHAPQNFNGRQTAEHIEEWQKLTSCKVILQVVRRETMKFENDIPAKYNTKNPSFFQKKR